MSSVIRGSDNFDSGTVGSTTYGAVGTYVFATRDVYNLTEGNTYAGSSLRPAGIARFANDAADDHNQAYITRGGSYLTGTWRVMGRVKTTYSTTNYMATTLFVRIS